MHRLNRVIVKLVVADFFLNSGWGLIAPIFALFVTQQIQGGSLEIVAFAVATFWITKSIVQPFLANFLDIIKGDKDDFNFLIFGAFLASLVPLGYYFANQVWHIFFLEFIRGIAMACVVPAWFGIFTKHINKGWEAFSWSIQSTSFGFAAGLSAAFGGIVAVVLGFQTVFLFICLLKLISVGLLVSIRNNIFPEDKLMGRVFKKIKKD